MVALPSTAVVSTSNETTLELPDNRSLTPAISIIAPLESTISNNISDPLARKSDPCM